MSRQDLAHGTLWQPGGASQFGENVIRALRWVHYGMEAIECKTWLEFHSLPSFLFGWQSCVVIFLLIWRKTLCFQISGIQISLLEKKEMGMLNSAGDFRSWVQLNRGGARLVTPQDLKPGCLLRTETQMHLCRIWAGGQNMAQNRAARPKDGARLERVAERCPGSWRTAQGLGLAVGEEGVVKPVNLIWMVVDHWPREVI